MASISNNEPGMSLSRGIGKTKLSLCLIKYCDIEANGGLECPDDGGSRDL
jgi:hypothetical protein